MRVADPVSCRPGINVQVLLLTIAVLNGIDATRATHGSELVGGLVDEVKVPFPHLYAVTDHVATLIRVLRGSQTLS